jgi:hypothetical protein
MLRRTCLTIAALLLIAFVPTPLSEARRDRIEVYDFSGLPTAATSVRGWERRENALRYHDRGTKRCDNSLRQRRTIVICLLDPGKSSYTIGNGRKGGALIHVSLDGDPVYDENTICHELGHDLGIAGHPPVSVPTADSCMQDDSPLVTPGRWDLAQLPAEKRARAAREHKRHRR